MFRRSFWGLSDQAVSSLSSLLLAVMVARVATPAEVGAWAIAFGLYSFILTVARATFSTTALISRNEIVGDDDRSADRGAATWGLVFGACVGTLLFLASFFAESPLISYLGLFGIAMPVLLVQDSIRYSFIRNRRTHLAALVDVVWLGVQIFAGLIASSYLGGIGVVLGWAIGALASTVVGLLFSGPIIGMASAVWFARSHRSIGLKLLIDSILSAGVANFLPLMLGLILGLSATGFFRGGLTLTGIIGIAIMGLTPIATVEILKRVHDRLYTHKFVALWSVFVAAAGLSLLVLLWFIPDEMGMQLLGETWYGTKEVLLPMSLQVVFRGPMIAVQIVLRSAHKLDSSIGLRVIHGISVLVLTGIGASVGGLGGAAWAWVATSLIGSFIAMIFYWRFVSGGLAR